MSAGTGILHSREERLLAAAGRRPSTRDPVHFVQMWVVPDEGGITPGYEQLEIDDELLSGGLVPVASGMPGHDGAAAIRIKNRYAALHAARLPPARASSYPKRPSCTFSFPAAASRWRSRAATTGDAVRFTATGGQRVTAVEPAEILVWEMHAALG